MKIRSRCVPALLAAVLVCGLSRAAEPKSIKALYISGGCCHDYKHQKTVVTEGISKTLADKVKIDWTIYDSGEGSTTFKAEPYKKADWYKGYDLVVHDECWADVNDRDFIAGILKAHGPEGKVPAVNLHCTMHCYRKNIANEKMWTFRDWFAFTGVESHGHGPQKPIAIHFLDPATPINKGLSDWTTINEELYNNFEVMKTAVPVAKGKQSFPGKDGKVNDVEWVVSWTNLYQGTRVFSTTLGHNTATCADQRYLDHISNGVLYALGMIDGPKAP